MATHELPGEGGLVLLFYRKLVLSLSFSADFPLWLCSSPLLVLTGNALLWAFCLYKLDLACYGSVILFWLSL